MHIKIVQWCFSFGHFVLTAYMSCSKCAGKTQFLLSCAIFFMRWFCNIISQNLQNIFRKREVQNF